MRNTRAFLLGAILLLLFTPFALAVAAQSQQTGKGPTKSNSQLTAEQGQALETSTPAPGGITNPRTPTATETATSAVSPTPSSTSTSIAPPTATAGPSEPVAWTNGANVTAAGNSLEKTGGVAATWDAGAISTRAIMSGDGYVEATVDALNSYRMFGLSNGDSGPSHTDIDFAAYLAGGTLKVYERGGDRGSFGPLAVGDVVRVAVSSNAVQYYHNGLLFYTSASAPVYPLLVDTAINSSYGKIADAYISGANLGPSGVPNSSPTPTYTRIATTVVNPSPTRTFSPVVTATPTRISIGACEPVAWTNLKNVTATGNSIQKTGGVAATWDAGAVSTRAILSGDGYVQASVDALNTWKMFGLSKGDTSGDQRDIDFAAFIAGSTLEVYESGVMKGTFGTLAVGDILKVSVESGVVKYYLNGVAFYTSATAPVYPMLLDTSINSSYGKLVDLYICGTNLGSGGSSSPVPTYTATTVPTLTNTPTQRPTNTNTNTPSNTPTNSPTNTPTRTPTNSPTNVPTRTFTPTPITQPPTPTFTPSSLRSFYVSPNGSDTNPGTAAYPWQSLHKAASSLQAGDTAIFLDGTYVETAQVVFANSGTPSNPITIRSATKWGATLLFQGLADQNKLVIRGTPYITVQDFDITQDTMGTIWADKLVQCWWGADGCKIVGNKLHHAMQPLKAYGNSYTVMDNNLFFDAAAGPEAFNAFGTTISNNEVFAFSNSSADGIVLKGGSRSGRVFNNYIHVSSANSVPIDGGIFLGGYSCATPDCGVYDPSGYEGYNLVAYNNVVVSDPGMISYGLMIEGCTDCAFLNNVVVGARWGMVTVHGGTMADGWNWNVLTNNARFQNNIIQDITSSATSFRDVQGTTTLDYNLFYNAPSSPSQAHGVYANPLFVNLLSDWHLQPLSPALGAGTATSFIGYNGETIDVSHDRSGLLRTIPWSMGIYR